MKRTRWYPLVAACWVFLAVMRWIMLNREKVDLSFACAWTLLAVGYVAKAINFYYQPNKKV